VFESVYWINVAQVETECRADVSALGFKMWGNFLISSGNNGFSGRLLLHIVTRSYFES